jgi:microcystin-dependent protein
MAEPFVGEIRMWGCNFAPRNWAICDGRTLPISQYTSLFSVIGTYYGGDGRSTCGLPDLRGRAPMHPGHGPGLTARRIGNKGGVETVTLNESQLPAHGHEVAGSTSHGDYTDLTKDAILSNTETPFYQSDSTQNLVATGNGSVKSTGGNQPHSNMQPFLVVNFTIALVGTYPSRP